MTSSIEKTDRNLPEGIINQLIELDLKGFSEWDSGKFADAEKTFLEELEIIRKKEKEEKRAIHKGASFYNLAISLAYKGKMDEAIIYFLQAYVEDTLGVDYGQEDEADGAPAFRVLRYLFRLRIDVILEINKHVFAIKQKGQWKNAVDPLVILKQVETSLGLKLSEVSTWVKVIPEKFTPKMPLGFPQPWEHRVFIGGAYRNSESMKALYKIKDAVRRKDFRYIPIMGLDVYVDKEIHHRTLLLLHTCKWAIFEVTFPAGQLMEIERSLDYETRLLILYKKENSDIPESVSSMTRTIPQRRATFRGYKTIEDIPSIIAEFLPRFEDAGKNGNS